MDAADGRGEEEEILLGSFTFFLGVRDGNKETQLSTFLDTTKTSKQSNVPALNDLLAPFGIAFGDAVLEGPVGGVFVGEAVPPPSGAKGNNGKSFDFASGANIARFPAGGTLFEARLTQRASEGVAATPFDGGKDSQEATDGEGGLTGRHAILGLARAGAGAVAAFGDSGCLDSSHQRGDCFWMLDKVLDFAVSGKRDPALFGPPEEAEGDGALAAPFALQTGGNGNAGGDSPLPSRPLGLPSEEALPFSSVRDRNADPPVCEPNSALQFAGAHWPAVAREKSRKTTTEKEKTEAGGAAAGGAASGAAAAAGATKPSRKDLLPRKDGAAAIAAAVDGDTGSAETPLHTNSSGRNGKSHQSSSSSSTRPRSPPTSTSSSSSSSTSYPAASYYSSAALNAKNLVRSAGSRAGIVSSHASASASPVALAGAGAAAALCVWAAVRARRRRAAAGAAEGGDSNGNTRQRYSRVAAPVSPGSLADYGVELGNALRRPGALTSSNSRPSAAHLKE